MIRIPSINNMVDRLKVDKATAKKVREVLDTISPAWIEEVLEKVSDIIGGFGVEYIEPVNSDGGLYYVNMGDIYTETIVFDSRSKTLWCCSWGAIVEAQGKRFGF